MSYSVIENKSFEDLEKELILVFKDYEEYSNPLYGSGKLEDMISLFAKDNFYNLHLVAKEYLAQRTKLLGQTIDYRGWIIQVTHEPDYQSHPYEWHVWHPENPEKSRHNDPTSYQTYQGAVENGKDVVDYFIDTPGPQF